MAASYIDPMGQLTVWHDDGCPLCRAEVALMRRLDRRGAIEFIGLSDVFDADCPVDRADLLQRFHARENGVMLSGAAAFVAIWRAIPILRPLGLIARRPSLMALLERSYRMFLKIRPRLQRFAFRLGAA